MAEAPTYTETATSNVPEWARKYAQDILGFGAALTYPKFNPQTGKLESGFQPYAGELVAGLSPLQQQAMSDLSRMQVAPQTGQATGLTGLAALQAQNLARYQPSNIQAASVTAPGGYQAERVSPGERVTAGDLRAAQTTYSPTLSMFQMGSPEQVTAERFGLGAIRDYMSPYMQEVVERQKQGAVQDYLRELPGIGAAAARVGGRGGTRETLLQSEARRNLSERLGDIEAAGLQQGYQQAAQQFGADRAALMQAALANQAAGLTTGQQNLAAALGVQQLGTQTGLQAALANLSNEQQARIQQEANRLQAQGMNQQAAMQAALANQQASARAEEFVRQQQMQAGMANQQAQMQAQQLAEQSRQFGAGLGLQGLQQQLAAAAQLGQLGQQQYQQQAGILGAQLGAGAQQQALKQKMLEANYARFTDEMTYPYKQLEFMSNLIRGIPSTDKTTSIYQPPPSTLGMLTGVTGGLGGLFSGIGS